MGILAHVPVRRDIDWYADRFSPSEALLFSLEIEDRCALVFLAAVPANAAEYRGHG
jgi:hypothetical protein